MGDIKPDLIADYFVGVRREPSSWSWEIHRRSRPMGIRLLGCNFRSEKAARLAGEEALRKLLEHLAQEPH